MFFLFLKYFACLVIWQLPWYYLDTSLTLTLEVKVTFIWNLTGLFVKCQIWYMYVDSSFMVFPLVNTSSRPWPLYLDLEGQCHILCVCFFVKQILNVCHLFLLVKLFLPYILLWLSCDMTCQPILFLHIFFALTLISMSLFQQRSGLPPNANVYTYIHKYVNAYYLWVKSLFT